MGEAKVQVCVVGAGIAGLAAAVRLRARGLQVTVLEANPYPGGKLSSIEASGYRFDAGPSLFTLPELVVELFRVAGRSPAGRFSYQKKEIACRTFFPDGARLRAYAAPAALGAEAERVLGIEAGRVTDYLAHAARTYELLGRLFLEHPLNAASTWLGRDALRALLGARLRDVVFTLHQVNQNRLGEPRMVQYFDRMATYNGSSPYRAPGVLGMIAHLEHNLGTFLPDGGMISITRSLVQLAEELGVQFELGCRVTRILTEGARVTGVEAKGQIWPCDIVVCNMDVVAAYRQLLPQLQPPRRVVSQERSSSALIFYWGLRGQFPELGLHNVFFAQNYASEFRALFEEGTIAADPTVYVYVTAKEVEGDAPPGCENWFVMVNAPPNAGQDWDTLIPRVRQNVLEKLERQLGQPIKERIEVERVLDPRSIEERTSSVQGALYGSSSNSKLSAFLRHPNASSVRGLYFCGGSVHPGGGIPLCLQSARIVSEQIRCTMENRLSFTRLRYPVSLAVLCILYAVGAVGLLTPWREELIALSFANLLATALLLLGNHEQLGRWDLIAFGCCALLGFGVEVLGVETGVIFGSYSYSERLGPRWLDVPLMIGVNWAVLLFAIRAWLGTRVRSLLGMVLLGATAMTLFDWLMEPAAIALGYWQWEGNQIPLRNYLAWWVVSLLLLGGLQTFRPPAKNRLAPAVLMCMLLFFAVARWS